MLSGQAPTGNPARGLVGIAKRDSHRGSLSLRGCLPVGIHLRCAVVTGCPQSPYGIGGVGPGTLWPGGLRGGPYAPLALEDPTPPHGDLLVFSAQENPSG